MGWVALSVNFRGTGGSAGDFSLAGWLTDLLAAVDQLLGEEGVNGVWMAGFGTGGTLSICAAARDLPGSRRGHAEAVRQAQQPGGPEHAAFWSAVFVSVILFAVQFAENALDSAST